MAQTTEMTAAIVDEPNAQFRIGTMPIPSTGPGQVLVRIQASALNPLDAKIRAGQAAHARHPLPAILGIDLAGIVEAVGSGVSGFQPGDEVYGMAGGVGGLQGSLAEFIAADANLLAIKPSNLGMREAASLPLALITAWEGLVDRVGVHAGQQVLIHGGAGGVGHIAVQLARALGASVFATASAKDQAYIEELGATPIDYRTTSVEDYLAAHTDGQGFDVVYDTLGGATLDASFAAVKHFGHVVSCLGWGTHALAPLSFRAATYSGVFTLYPLLTGIGRSHHGEILREATRLIEAGKIMPRVDPRRFRLDSVSEAYAALASGQTTGKLIVDVADVP